MAELKSLKLDGKVFKVVAKRDFFQYPFIEIEDEKGSFVQLMKKEKSDFCENGKIVFTFKKFESVKLKENSNKFSEVYTLEMNGFEIDLIA